MAADLDHAAEGVDVAGPLGRRDRAETADAGTVDQQVDRPRDLRRRGLHRLPVTDVAGDHARAFGRAAGEVERDDFGPRSEQRPGSRPSEPRIAAGDDGQLACRIHYLSRRLPRDFNDRYF